MNVSPASDREYGGLPMAVWDGLGLSNAFSGIGVFGAKLYEAMASLGTTPYLALRSDESVAWARPDRIFSVNTSRFSVVNRLTGLKAFYSVRAYGATLDRASRPDIVYHGLSNLNLPAFGPIRSGDRFVVTVFDITPILTSNVSALSLQMRALMPCVLSRADRVITVCEWTKEQLIDRYGSHLSEKIVLIPCGTAPASRPAPEGGEKPITGLTVARGEAYKRLGMIQDIARRMPNRRFVIVTDKKSVRTLGSTVENLELRSNVSARELDQLYDQTKMMLHPSLYEGWCLPAADAVQRGLKLIYCSGTGIDEVAKFAGERAYSLAPAAPIDQWIDLINALSRDAGKALAEPNLPTWLDVGQKTLNLYKSLV